MTIYELASVVRSKNAGPFLLTIDMLFDSPDDLARVLQSPGITPAAIAQSYGVAADQVRVHVWRSACAIKVTLPRGVSSGAPGDRDVYGSQQHLPLACIEIAAPASLP